jgi:glycosyltransferase involved in cell wall biosynthesis
MNSHLKISVVTVCYNAASTLENTILSVLHQTYSNIEYIIIDGGSTDGSVEIIKKYSNRLFYWISEPDKGIYDAMNKGGLKATGDFIQFLNSGDILYNAEVLSNVAKKILDSKCDVIYGDMVYVRNCGHFLAKPLPINKFDSTFPIFHPSTFVSTSIFKELLFDVNYRIAADFDFLRKVYYKGFKFSYLNKDPLVIFDAIDGVSSRNILRSWEEAEFVLGHNKNKNWRIIKTKKKISLCLNHILKQIILFISKSCYQRILIQKQLKDSRFTLLSSARE